MLRRKSAAALDYRLCNQTVTVYHASFDSSFSCTRMIHANAFLDFKKVQNVDKTGSRETNSFLLVIPGSGDPVSVGDKVLLGTGPEVTSREAWAAFVPSSVPGLVVVQYVDAKYYNGIKVHTEAGG